MLKSYETVLEVTNNLVQVESVVNTRGEIEIANKLYNEIRNIAYFKNNPSQTFISQTRNDEIERYNVFAFVKGTKDKSNKTVILMGHIDTVDIEDYHHLKSKACSPNALKEALKCEQLPDLVMEHVHSDNWHFGRGVLDMKSGVASHFYLLKYYAEHPEELNGNLVFFAECDEEDGSKGVLSGLHDLKRLKHEQGFDYVALINSDFVAPRYVGDPNRYIYKGSVGKLLPSFLIIGAETHAGSSFEGLDPNYLAAELTSHISYNPIFCDLSKGEAPMPPVSLKQTDFKPTYTIQTALSTYVYYNFFIQSWTPRQVLSLLKEQARIAFDQAILKLKQRHKIYCELSNSPYVELPWKARVILYEEMQQQLVAEYGSEFSEYMQKFKENLLLDESLDVRMFSAKVVEEEWKWMKDKSPAMILFYSSMYSPRIDLNDSNDKEANLIHALDQAIKNVQPFYQYPITAKNYFPYVCDMSCVSINDDEKGIETVMDNNPSWGSKHFVDYDAIRELNIPTINIGPYGYDAHNRYERVELDYSMKIVPNITNEVIKNLIN
ncbi:M20/M25/M40 family metallo-hydrolase [Lysinibacillus sp. NPDC056185]|uniref:M20/M25/M40 family metallo-hydrolase n=1 Tax=Lysinibacillus sp. NPDC056185 TaxID=3345739 RepID=UPI0039EED208